jgi:DNA mismatch repair protein MutS2
VPAFDPETVARRLEETAEAESFQIRHGRLPLAGIDELSARLAALEAAGGIGTHEEYRPVLAVARAAEAVRRALARAEGPRLCARRDALPRFETLLESARRLFAADGTVRDGASAQLSSVRSKLRRRRSEVSRRLEKLLEQRREVLGDAVVVLRNDRYCLPVQASARARVPGIVHDRSASGHTVFVEPMEIIEANNDLALLAAEERREVERLLTGFGREALAAAPQLLSAVENLAALDALEARVEFGRLAEGRLPEISEDGAWALAGARHPLLDARLAPLRRRVLGETREAREAVPLNLELGRDKKLLVVSGPNAGGKTVVLKTAGLFSLLAQSGFPLPAAAGTRLPVFRTIRTEIGDAQEILSDRSTFSSSMETLAEILSGSGAEGLALIDEIGGATDPEEGSALAVAFLEAYLARGGRAIVTTHLSAIKSFAAGREDALSAAMEFDEATGRPNYRLHPGLSGRSRALSVAREQGLPEAVLERARQILGEAWQRRESAETQAEAALERLRAAEAELEAQRQGARRETERLAGERKAFQQERKRLLDEGLAGFERARRELARRVESELEALRREPPRLARASTEELVGDSERDLVSDGVVAEARETALERTLALAPGDAVRLRGRKTEGRLVSLEADHAWLEVSGKRLRVPRIEIEPAGGPASSGSVPTRKGSVSGPSADPTEAIREINVIGRRLDEAVVEVEKALDEALLAGLDRLRIVHGHGTGRLRDGLREHFRSHPSISGLRVADPREGGNGVTILEMK